ncbi:nucleoside hydrolase-like isoform X1 [Argiope bruennichi]|uniref:nucleoside hydrolase-like isoform X1 n=1 Tax=Argiope bruennichi TaxID=94029 RepID=UPI002493D0DB|nr:nucleoside hydrolase-like isoform X1 [Argiope bruennichi]
MGSVEKVIVDTDCGVDDAMALMLALSSKRARVVAITCVFGNTPLDNVCNNVKRVLVVCDKKEVKIPIYRGSGCALIPKVIRKDSAYHGGDGLGTFAHEFSTGDLPESDVPAPMALIQLTKEQPGEITLIAIGPLTNLALAHRIDPQFTKRLKSLVVMGGNYKGLGNVTETAEFNFHSDPEAAHIVLGEALCPVKLVPWETCLEFNLSFATYDRLVQVATAKGSFYKRITGIMKELAKSRSRTFCTDCDLSAVAATLYPECIRKSLVTPLVVECNGTYTRAITVLLNHVKSLKDHGRCDVQIITELDVDFLNQLRYQMLQDEPIRL